MISGDLIQKLQPRKQNPKESLLYHIWMEGQEDEDRIEKEYCGALKERIKELESAIDLISNLLFSRDCESCPFFYFQKPRGAEGMYRPPEYRWECDEPICNCKEDKPCAIGWEAWAKRRLKDGLQ
jgi:hypothetical protein